MPDLNAEVKVVMITCCSCKVPFWIEAGHQSRLRDSHEWFYCPNGDAQHYGGEPEAKKLQKIIDEKDRLLNVAYNERLDLMKLNVKLKKSVDSYRGYLKSRKIPSPPDQVAESVARYLPPKPAEKKDGSS